MTENEIERIAQRVAQLLLQGTSTELVTTSDICRLTGKSRRTVYRKIEEGILPKPQRVGRELVFDRATFLKARMQGKI